MGAKVWAKLASKPLVVIKPRFELIVFTNIKTTGDIGKFHVSRKIFTSAGS